jgi:hypothetical protein
MELSDNKTAWHRFNAGCEEGLKCSRVTARQQPCWGNCRIPFDFSRPPVESAAASWDEVIRRIYPLLERRTGGEKELTEESFGQAWDWRSVPKTPRCDLWTAR